MKRKEYNHKDPYNFQVLEEYNHKDPHNFQVFQNLKIRTRSLYRRLLHLRCRGEDKGLCYYCDEKWNPGHKCKVPKSYIMEGMEFSKEERQENYLEQTAGEDLYLSRDL